MDAVRASMKSCNYLVERESYDAFCQWREEQGIEGPIAHETDASWSYGD